ncbi:hypothetical protein AMS68_004476 [Peltaster fructicola]|uniref:Zn(2)-C6 fungal-type domain-containing protein n=1 Tax=Peltaster fructicola TaxID=286661 RepID=A0A6H0XWG4_9PEZI|nr:hypothetical protein AMS68_004476 [Peltaster fructicola]
MEAPNDVRHGHLQRGTSRNNPRDSKIDVPGHTQDREVAAHTTKPKSRSRRKATQAEDEDISKRRCVSTACIACRKRKSKCDGNTPACAACSQVYNTECIYDPNSDHRRKGVYKNDADNVKAKDSTLHILIQAILNSSEDDVPDLIRDIRTCESLDDIAERIVAKSNGEEVDEDLDNDEVMLSSPPSFESKLYGKMGDLRLDAGAVRYIGGTSNLIYVGESGSIPQDSHGQPQHESYILSWTQVTDDAELVQHLLNMYFTWHYTFFTTLPKQLFYRDFELGRPPAGRARYCSPILVNAMLALGCHFTAHTGARDVADDSATAGDHFFREAKRLLMEDDVLETPDLTTVQALALMSVREAGCGREAKGWVYSGMSFRMSQDMGLHLDSKQLSHDNQLSGDENEDDARKITFWGGFLFDKCWSNYLGRLPQLPRSIVTTDKFEVFPEEDAADWSPYTDSGFTAAHSQPARTRAVALQIAKLCEISNDLIQNFYNPTDMDKVKGKQSELKKLSEIHTRLESWHRELPQELEPKEGGLSSVLVMHMFFQLLFIHLFRPFLRYTAATSPLPSNVSPRRLCTQAATTISKLLRLYKRSHGLRQICNIAVYIAHSACTIHLLNLPDKNARRDIIHGVKHMEEIAEGWLGARRSLGILSVLASRWNAPLPYEAEVVLSRTDAKFGPYKRDAQSPYDTEPKPSATISMPYMPTTPHMVQHVLGSTISGVQPPMFSHADNVQHTPTTSLGVAQAEEAATMLRPTGNKMSITGRGSKNFSTPRSDQSPSAIFGGIEQLLRDTQDWAYKDQAQFGAGFGNWNGLDDDQTTTTTTAAAAAAGWQETRMMNNALQHPSLAVAAPPARGSPASSAAFATHTATSVNVQDRRTPSDWTGGLNSMSASDIYNSMMSYNEDEWYQ